MYRRGSWDGALAGSLIGFALLLAVLAVLVLAWLCVKAFELVARVFVAHPRNRPLWIALGLLLILTLAAILTDGRSALLDALVGVSTLGLIATAKVVELYYDPRFQPELSGAQLVDDVLHRPWWQLEAA